MPAANAGVTRLQCHVSVESAGYGVADASAGGLDAALDALTGDGPLAYVVRSEAAEADPSSKSSGCCVISSQTSSAEAPWVALRVLDPCPWEAPIEGLCRLARSAGAEVLVHWPPPPSPAACPQLLCRREAIGQVVGALVRQGCLVSPALAVCPLPPDVGQAPVLPEDHVGAWKRKGSVPEVIRLQSAMGLFVDVSLPEPGSGAAPHASCGVISIDSQGCRRHCIVDFAPPQGPPLPRPLALSPQGNVLRVGAPEGGGGEAEEEWQRLDLSVGGPPTFTALELLSEEPVGSEARAGTWLFCGNTWARCVGPRLGEGIVAHACCKDLAQLLRWKVEAAEEVDKELHDRYEAFLGTVDRPGVLRLIRHSWTNVAPDTFFMDIEQGIGGNVSFSDGVMEHRLQDGQLQRWSIRSMPFNPFGDSSSKRQAIQSETTGNKEIGKEVRSNKENDKKARADSSSSESSRGKEKKEKSKSRSRSSSARKKEKDRDRDKKRRARSRSSSSSGKKKRKKKGRSSKRSKSRGRKRSRSRSRSDKKKRGKRKSRSRSKGKRKGRRKSRSRSSKSRSRSDKRKEGAKSKSPDKKKGRDGALSKSPVRSAVFDKAPAGNVVAAPATGSAALRALTQAMLASSTGQSQSIPPSLGLVSATAAMSLPNPEVEVFLMMNPVDPEAATRLRALPPHLQRIVMDRGPLMGTRNPSSVLIVRIRDAETGRGIFAQQGLGMPAPPPMHMANPNIERMIMQYNLDARAAGILRSLPPDQQRMAEQLPLHEARNPSAFVMAQLSMPGRMQPQVGTHGYTGVVPASAGLQGGMQHQL